MRLAIGVSALLWIVTARPGPVPPDDIIAMLGVEGSTLAGHSHAGTKGSSFEDFEPPHGGSDEQWRAQQHTIAAATESAWKSAPVHAALAATRSARPFETARAASSPDLPVRSAPYYLRHTPLLI